MAVSDGSQGGSGYCYGGWRVIRFHNTMTGKVEEFKPLEPGKVKIYTCGPTVYDFAHIGNFRTFMFQDILRRTLRLNGYELFHVMNITDVDDKIIKGANAAGESIQTFSQRYEEALFEDSAVLGLERPEVVCRATEHIDDMVGLIERLKAKGVTYQSEGSTYFRIADFPNYGKLSGVDMSGIKAGARVDSDEYDKADPRDFVLWKASKTGEPSWDTPLGPGRPGWHIECSAMSMRFLGETFDIHTGGTDLVFPHHTNEIAQSEAATGKPFVGTWLHAEHLIVEGQKMSKSLGNFFTLRDLLKKGFKPSAIRLCLASVPYRRQLNFSVAGLHQATQSIERLRNFLLRLRSEKLPEGESATLKLAEQAKEEFDAALADDLNTAEALGAVFNIVRDANTALDRGELRSGDVPAIESLMERFDSVFDVLADDNDRLAPVKDKLELSDPGSGGGLTDDQVEALLTERREARAGRDFARSDEIRDQLIESGIIVEDSRDGVRWRRK